MNMPFVFEPQDLVAVGFLVFLEGILSIDNALVLAVLVRSLPEKQRQRALTYGMAGAFIFRALALFLIKYLMEWVWIKFVGGGYLLYLSVNELVIKKLRKKSEEKVHQTPDVTGLQFWRVVLLVELTDIAFAIDSILASVAVSQKFWVVLTGGILGIIMMRFAARFFVGLLEKFPRFETIAYVLVLIVGFKLFLEGFEFPQVDFHSKENPAFWIFWGSMGLTVISGFLMTTKKAAKES